jgi:hypothetical protein
VISARVGPLGHSGNCPSDERYIVSGRPLPPSVTGPQPYLTNTLGATVKKLERMGTPLMHYGAILFVRCVEFHRRLLAESSLEVLALSDETRQTVMPSPTKEGSCRKRPSPPRLRLRIQLAYWTLRLTQACDAQNRIFTNGFSTISESTSFVQIRARCCRRELELCRDVIKYCL